jgi:hypothetical protein
VTVILGQRRRGPPATTSGWSRQEPASHRRRWQAGGHAGKRQAAVWVSEIGAAPFSSCDNVGRSLAASSPCSSSSHTGAIQVDSSTRCLFLAHKSWTAGFFLLDYRYSLIPTFAHECWSSRLVMIMYHSPLLLFLKKLGVSNQCWAECGNSFASSIGLLLYTSHLFSLQASVSFTYMQL